MTVAELSVRRPVTVVMVHILICVIACVFMGRIYNKKINVLED